MIIKIKKLYYDIFDSTTEAFFAIYTVLYCIFSYVSYDQDPIFLLSLFVDYIIWCSFMYSEKMNKALSNVRKLLIPIIWFSLLLSSYFYNNDTNNKAFLCIVLICFTSQSIKIYYQSQLINLKMILFINLITDFILTIESINVLLLSFNIYLDINIPSSIYLLNIILLVFTLLFIAIINSIFPNILYNSNTFKVSFILHNLDIKAIRNELYFSNDFDKERKNYNIIKVDLSKIFEYYGLKLEDFVIKNILCTKAEIFSQHKDFFYLYVTNNTNNSKIIFDAKFTNKNNKKKIYKLRLDISFKNVESVTFVERYKLIVLTKYLFKRNFNKNKELICGDYNKLFLAYNSIFIDENYEYTKMREALNAEAICGRKWIEHEDEFGNGKSLLDKLVVNSVGYSALRVSSWESGYGDDFIRAIYNKLKNNKGVSNVMMITILSTIFLSLSGELISHITTLIHSTFKNLNQNIIYLLIILILFTIVILFYTNLRLDILLFKKDGTKLFEESYIKFIRKKLMNNNIMLIIEDADRLSEEQICHVFSKLSLLNNSINVNRQLGILSYSKSELFYKTNNLEVNKKYQDIKEKVISISIDTTTNSSTNKKRYIEINNNYLKEYYGKNLTGDLNMSTNKCINISFREIKTRLYNYLSSNFKQL